MTQTRHTANDGPELMVLTLILGDQLHRDWFSPSPLQLAAGNRVLMIEDLAVASAYHYHKLRLLHMSRVKPLVRWRQTSWPLRLA
jgi:hypothetical protein